MQFPKFRPADPKEWYLLMNVRRFAKGIGVVVVLALGSSLAACGGGSSASSSTPNLTVSYSEVVADELPLWIAEDAGYFKDQGLTVNLKSVSSDQGFPALISGQTQLASIGGSEIISGAASGANVKVLATLTPVLPYELWTKATDAAGLKGKKIGITSKSGSIYIATLQALRLLGLSVSDVTLIPLGSTTNVNNALLAGTIDAAVSHPPASSKFQAAGFHSLIDLAQQKQPGINVGIASTADFIKSNSSTVTKFMTALKQAIQRERNDEQYCLGLIKQHLGVSDQKALEQTWQYYAKDVVPSNPTPTVDELKAAQQSLSSVKGVSSLNLNKLLDTSFATSVFGPNSGS